MSNPVKEFNDYKSTRKVLEATLGISKDLILLEGKARIKLESWKDACFDLPHCSFDGLGG